MDLHGGTLKVFVVRLCTTYAEQQHPCVDAAAENLRQDLFRRAFITAVQRICWIAYGLPECEVHAAL